MKVALITLVLCGIVGVSIAAKECTKQSDCEKDECCLDTLFSKRTFCEKRYAAGKGCPPIAIYKQETDMYRLVCPCVDKYECLGKGVSSDDGHTYMKNAKCIMPTV